MIDKEKIKTEITEVKTVIDELIEEGKLDGDLGKRMVAEFTSQAIREEVAKSREVG